MSISGKVRLANGLEFLRLARLLNCTLNTPKLPEARDGVTKAIAADPQFVYPHQQLYLIAFEEVNWRELADTTNRSLRLDPC
jgi:hypothetical protein